MLRKSLTVGFLALVVAVAVGTSAQAAVSSWLSTVSTVGGGFTPSDPSVDLASGATGSLYLWLRNDAKLQSVAYNLTAATPGIVEFTGVTVYTPDLLIPPSTDIGDRWNTPIGAGTISADKQSISNFSAVNVDKSGLDVATRSFDQLWDATANAGLFAKIDYSAIGSGTTALNLTEGSTLIVENSLQPPLTFGSASITVAGVPGTAPTIADLTFATTTLNEVVSLTPIDLTGDPDPTWADLSGPTYTPGFGSPAGSPGIGAAGFTWNPATQAFEFNTAGSSRGTYVWTGSATNATGTDAFSISVDVTQVPEPATFAMVGMALVGMVGVARRRS